jgi:hypothetical protein
VTPLDAYHAAARRHDAEPSGPGRIATMAALIRAMLDLSPAEYERLQDAAWRRHRIETRGIAR